MSRSDDEVLVRGEGVSKKFCRSLKKSLWYGVCDIAGELLPGRKRRETRDEGRESRAIRQISSRHQPLASGHWTLDSRLLFRSPCGRILRRQGCQLRTSPGGIEDPGTVRKRDFKEMPWCNQGAGLREETASMPRADWAQRGFASFAGCGRLKVASFG
jgi:hypothetical protein